MAYHLTQAFPTIERYRLAQQMTRAVVSVPAHIAERHARAIPKEYAHFLSIAKGSLMETQTYLTLARRWNFVADTDAEGVSSLNTEISKMLTTLRIRLV